MIKKIPLSLLIFIYLIPLIFFLEFKLLDPHLRYGFADIDWGFLLNFKELSALYDNPIDHLIHAWRTVGVYTYSVYYVGFLEHFFPINDFNFSNIHQATHFFKFLSALTLFPLILVLTKKKLLAAITTILYAVAYPAVGPIYTVGVSGNYLAIAVMNLFLAYYILMVKNNKLGFIWLSAGIFLFLLTLFLSTERMYPLIPLIILGEFFWVWSQRFSQAVIKVSFMRIAVFLLPLVIILLLRILIGESPFGDIPGFFVSSKGVFQKILEGNWSIMLTPFIAFGSLFFPREYWGLIGSNRNIMESLVAYLGFFLGLFFLFFILTIFLSFFITRKPARFLFLTSLSSFILGMIVFILANHHFSIEASLRLNFDPMFMKPALIGALIISWSLSCLINWVLGDKDKFSNLYLFLGPAIAFLFIIFTWVFASHSLIFEGVHRYLAIPAIGSSFFIATLITLIYEKISKITVLRNISWLVFLSLIPIIQLNFFVVGNYFNKELNFAGMNGAEQRMMKNKLVSYMGDFDLKEPTLFYFDEQDHLNGYFQETAIIAGFNTWIRFRGRSMPILGGVTPIYIRNSHLGSETNVYCSVQIYCFTKLRDYVTIKNGEKGILYKEVFYPPNRFYAFRLKNRDVFDIKEEVLQEIGLMQ